jgi:hypothetical protein
MNEAAGNWVVPLFPEEEIPHILEALLRSLRGFRKLDDSELETSLTKRLCAILKRDPYIRDGPVWPDREAVEDDEGTGSEGRLDLRFILLDRSSKPPPYFAIEAKRLHLSFNSGWKSLVSEYVTGHQGMMCFITSRYSKGLRSGAMLGYVFDGDIDRAVKLVSMAVETNRDQLKLTGSQRLMKSKMVGCESAWETNHALPNGDFTVFHLLADV